MLNTAKITANRNNATMSTGPRSAHGIARASRNAITHGLTSVSTVVIEGLEDRAEYEHLLGSIIFDLNANGIIETLLAERIAQLFWRLGRVTRFETEYLSQWHVDLAPNISDLNIHYDNQRKRERVASALAHLFLPERTMVDQETVDDILNAFADFLTNDERQSFSAGSYHSDSLLTNMTTKKQRTVGSLTKLLRSVESRLGHSNLIATVYDSWLLNNRNWNSFNDMLGSAGSRKRTEALLLQVERASLIDRYEPRIRRDLSRTMKDLLDLQCSRRQGVRVA